MHYRISMPETEFFLRLEWTIGNIHQDMLQLQLPSWRPGRYELQNYARNIRKLTMCDDKGGEVSFRKVTKDRWEVRTKGVKTLVVSYEYFACQLDAGASYVTENFLYVNPVNCLMYAEGRMDEPYEVELVVPDDFRIACQLPVTGKTLTAQGFDELADAPFMAGSHLHHTTFAAGDTTMHFWFSGSHSIDIAQLQQDTVDYTVAQVKLFGDMPLDEYHFLYIMLPQRFHHGVEHAGSTVIAMGQGDDTMDADFYDEFISISSHELFHLWNVKRIRPADMLPYDFTRENYSTLGYVYEGVTTYYGDLMLLRCGVWDWDQFAEKFNYQLKRHFDNDGRFNYSVAESSWDTWLDGYVPGVKGRKVSIYVEGMLAALVADIMIIHHSKGKHSLDDVMRDLYQAYKDGEGYTEQSYRAAMEKYAGMSFEDYFRDAIWGKNRLEGLLNEWLPAIGCALKQTNKGPVIEQTGEKKPGFFGYWSGSRG